MVPHPSKSKQVYNLYFLMKLLFLNNSPKFVFMKMPKLNLPIADLKFKLVEGTTQVFDVVRKKYIQLNLEEWVRQNFIYYLHKDKGYPLSLMGVERQVGYNSLNTRADIVVYNRGGSPIMIVECKSPNVKITQDAFYQIAKYNAKLKVDILIVTNGMKHFCCKMDYEDSDHVFLGDIPEYRT